MSHVLGLLTVYEVARVVLPAFAESLVREIDREEADARLATFAKRVVARARIRLQVQGHERVPAERAFVYMFNHQSHMDIPVMYASVPAQSLRMVAKKELFRIPFWSRALRVGGFIEIDRGDRVKAIASIDRAAARVRQGISMGIAPEGTRSQTGRLGPLKKGGFHLAKNTGTPIVPVAIEGTCDVLPPGSGNMAYDRPVNVVIGAPIEVEGRSIEELMSEVETFLRANNGKG